MPASVKYYYIGTSAPSQAIVPPGGWNVFDTNQTFNNIFNFPTNFFNKLNSISSIDLGKSVPFVSLKTLNVDGQVLEDLNLKFIQNGINMRDINSGARYSDRPIMSLKDVEIKTNNASGYLYYTEVVIKLKIHRPDQMQNTTLVSLMFPGQPMLLEYGWHSDSDNEILTNKDFLYFAVKSYNVTVDQTGQIDLTVEGMSYNEQFSNTIIGDFGEEINTDLATKDGTIHQSLAQLQEASAYLQEIVSRGSGGINCDMIKKRAEEFQSKEKKVRQTIAKNFETKLRELPNTFSVSIPNKKNSSIECLTVNDIVSSLCNRTFTAMTSLFPGVGEFRVIYGNFNENCGPYSNTSIADFPVDKKAFDAKIKELVSNGDFAMNVEKLLNSVIYEFAENTEYWRKLLTPDAVFDIPDIAMNFVGHRDRTGAAYVSLFIVDAKIGVPPTLSRIGSGVRSQEDIKNDVLRGLTIPVMTFGHANSFIKNISMTQIVDQYMKASLISKMSEERLSSVRSAPIPGLDLYATPIQPLTLPLKGTAEVIGNVEWKPFRSFYLSSGIFLIDGIYKIISVRHSINSERFGTSIEFMWH